MERPRSSQKRRRPPRSQIRRRRMVRSREKVMECNGSVKKWSRKVQIKMNQTMARGFHCVQQQLKLFQKLLTVNIAELSAGTFFRCPERERKKIVKTLRTRRSVCVCVSE